MMQNIKRVLKILILIFFPVMISACASSKSSSEAESMEQFAGVDGEQAILEDRMPMPYGGMEAIYREIHYPKSCLDSGAQGRVVVQFIVNADGSTRNHNVLRGIHPSCDRAVIMAVRRVRWRHGIIDGEAAAVQYQLPINFRLN